MRHRWMTRCRPLLGLVLIPLLACGGGSPSAQPARATRIVYTPPATGTYQLLPDTSRSTDTHLVLNLLGPTGTSGRGVAFHLAADPAQLLWSKVDSGDAESAQSAAFEGSYGFLLKTKVASGNLQVGAFLTQDISPSVTFGPTVQLATVALDLAPGAPPGTATLRADNGTAVLLSATLGADPVPITIAVGTITLH